MDNNTFFFAYFSEIVENHIEMKYFLASLHYIVTFTYIAIMIVLNVLIYKNCKSSKSTTNYTLRVRYLNNNESNLEFDDETSDTHLTFKAYENNRITLMIFWISCVFIAEQFLCMLVPTIVFAMEENRFSTLLRSLALIVLFRSISSILNTFLFYIFYHEYRKILKQNLDLLAYFIILTTSLITFFLVLDYYF